MSTTPEPLWLLTDADGIPTAVVAAATRAAATRKWADAYCPEAEDHEAAADPDNDGWWREVEPFGYALDTALAPQLHPHVPAWEDDPRNPSAAERYDRPAGPPYPVEASHFDEATPLPEGWRSATIEATFVRLGGYVYPEGADPETHTDLRERAYELLDGFDWCGTVVMDDASGEELYEVG